VVLALIISLSHLSTPQKKEIDYCINSLALLQLAAQAEE